MRLEGERIYLRSWRAADVERLAEICSDRSIYKFTRVPKPYNLREAKKFIADSKKAWGKTDYRFAIVLKGENKIVGSIDFRGIDGRDMNGSIGYLMEKNYRGKGLTPEAVRLVLGLAFDRLKMVRVEITCATDNRASRKVIEKVGGKFEGIARNKTMIAGRPRSDRVYSILKEEWKRQKKKLKRRKPKPRKGKKPGKTKKSKKPKKPKKKR